MCWLLSNTDDDSILIMIVIAIFSLMVVAQQAQHFYDNDYEHVDDNEYGCDGYAYHCQRPPSMPCHCRVRLAITGCDYGGDGDGKDIGVTDRLRCLAATVCLITVIVIVVSTSTTAMTILCRGCNAGNGRCHLRRAGTAAWPSCYHHDNDNDYKLRL